MNEKTDVKTEPNVPKIALFWLVLSLPLAFALGPLFIYWDINWFGKIDASVLSGWILGVCVGLTSALILVVWWRPKVNSMDFAIFWFGSALLISLLLWPLVDILYESFSSNDSAKVGLGFFLLCSLLYVIIRSRSKNESD